MSQRMLHQCGILVSACALTFLLAGCPPPDCDGTCPSPTPEPTETPTPPPEGRLIEIIATEFDFNPEQIYAEPGESLIISLRNEGTVDHNIEFELPQGDIELENNVPPQGTAQLSFTAPTTPGDYVFYCPIDDHRALGMEGRLTVQSPTNARLQSFATGLTSPVTMAMAPDLSGRMFIVDQIGLIYVLMPDGTMRDEPFLDIRDRLVELDPDYDERGLLGLAFHPDYATNGRFFVYYSAPPQPTTPEGYPNVNRLSEFMVSADPDLADPDSERILLSLDKPQTNHNGGTVLFGPDDDYLYLSLGDGGGAGDIGMGHTPDIGNAQDITNLLGSILRIDVDGAEPYAIPPDNPFVGREGRDEIYAYGLRNPYRMSFDMGGDHGLYVGDSGQNLWEEVDRVALGGNYGWNILEGTHCFNTENFDLSLAVCANVGPYGGTLQWPIIEFANAAQRGGLGQVVVGGYVYRGSAIPALYGQYIYGVWNTGEDARTGALFRSSAISGDLGDLWPVRRVFLQGRTGGVIGHYLLGFFQDDEGELYILTTDNQGPTGETGRIFRLAPPT